MSKPNPFLEVTELTYDQVSWYRKRWFFFVTLLFFAPASVLLILSGELYAKKDNCVYKFSKKGRMLFIFISVMLCIQGVLRMMR